MPLDDDLNPRKRPVNPLAKYGVAIGVGFYATTPLIGMILPQITTGWFLLGATAMSMPELPTTVKLFLIFGGGLLVPTAVLGLQGLF